MRCAGVTHRLKLIAETDVAGWETLRSRTRLIFHCRINRIGNSQTIRSAGIGRNESAECVYSSTIIIIIRFWAILLFTFMFLLFMRFVLNEIMILKLWINRSIDDDDDDDKIDLSFLKYHNGSNFSSFQLFSWLYAHTNWETIHMFGILFINYVYVPVRTLQCLCGVCWWIASGDWDISLAMAESFIQVL